MPTFIKNRRLQSGSSGVVLPTGSSAQRPDNPAFGLIRYNTDTGFVEYFNGSIFVSLATGGAVNYVVDTFTGTGSQTTFTMSQSAANVDQIIVFVGSVYQDPLTAYTLSGGGYDINFTSAPPNTMPINVIHTNS
jgi:hypothetical protein